MCLGHISAMHMHVHVHMRLRASRNSSKSRCVSRLRPSKSLSSTITILLHTKQYVASLREKIASRSRMASMKRIHWL